MGPQGVSGCAAHGDVFGARMILTLVIAKRTRRHATKSKPFSEHLNID